MHGIACAGCAAALAIAVTLFPVGPQDILTLDPRIMTFVVLVVGIAVLARSRFSSGGGKRLSRECEIVEAFPVVDAAIQHSLAQQGSTLLQASDSQEMREEVRASPRSASLEKREEVRASPRSASLERRKEVRASPRSASPMPRSRRTSGAIQDTSPGDALASAHIGSGGTPPGDLGGEVGGEDFFASVWKVVEGRACRDHQVSLILRAPTPLRVAHEVAEESAAEEDDGVSPQELALLAVLNLATFDDLRDLKGIGPKSAEKIMAYRTQTNQELQRLDDLVTKVGLRRLVVNRLVQSMG